MTVRSIGYSDGKVNLWIDDEAVRLTPTEAIRLARDLLASANLPRADYPMGSTER